MWRSVGFRFLAKHTWGNGNWGGKMESNAEYCMMGIVRKLAIVLVESKMDTRGVDGWWRVRSCVTGL